MKYFPLESAEFSHQFGVRAIPEGATFVEATDQYHHEIQLKRRQLSEYRDDYYRATLASEEACSEAFRFLSGATPFIVRTNGGADVDLAGGSQHSPRNELLAEPVLDDSPDPLLSIARHLQEDLVLLSPDPAKDFPVVAGVVCFPSGWCIADKMGAGMGRVHRPVPQYAEQLGDATSKLLARLKPGRPVWRTNWGVRASSRLDQSPRRGGVPSGETLPTRAADIGTRCFFRVERQTLVRLPETGHVLFAIHTHQCAVGRLSMPRQRVLSGVIRSCPEETLGYKGILPFRDELIAFLPDHE